MRDEETDVSLLDAFQTEWAILRRHRPNVLLEGPGAATDAMRRLLEPYIREPIARNQPHAPLELPGGETGALILRDVDGLSVDDQARLLVWLGGPGSRTQLVSTTRRPLFALVAHGLFDQALYYRLNVMLLRVGSTDLYGLQTDDAGLPLQRVPPTLRD